jgi:peptidoglycan/LPS O-acetylase OafA/YrhL
MTINEHTAMAKSANAAAESMDSNRRVTAVESVHRLEVLDALRGFAAVAVVLYHYTIHYSNHFAPAERALVLFSRGNLGVDLFFCISGFVISMTLDRCRDWRDFAVRRFARIYPAYAAALLFTYYVLSHSDLPKFHYGVIDLLMNFTMLQQLLGFSHIDGVYWTLQVELLFYVIIGLLYFGGFLRSPRRICLVWLLLCSAYAWIQQVHPTPLASLIGELLLLKYAPLFIVGMLAWDSHKRGSMDREGLTLVCLCIAFQLTTSLLFAGLAAALGFAMLMVAAKVRLPQRWPTVMFFGNISFSLYLVHQHFGYMVIHEAIKSGATLDQGIALALLASICVASLITFLIEKPMQRLIVRNWKASVVAAAAVSSTEGTLT